MTEEQQAMVAAVFKHGSLKKLERAIIDAVFEYCGRSPARTATALGVCRKTVYNLTDRSSKTP